MINSQIKAPSLSLYLLPISIAFFLAITLVSPHTVLANQYKNTKIIVQKVNGNVHMITGAGGNIGASIGTNGTLIVDSQFAPLSKRIKKALKKNRGNYPQFILNTHFHGDHIGGNSNLNKKGIIIAHKNVRLRLLNDPKISASALPVITMQDNIQINYNNEQIDLIHLANGHTDGDIVVWFKDSKVIHMGDLLFAGRFPFIDRKSGGSVQGTINALQTIIAMLPTDTHVIPGHGKLGDLNTIKASLNMIKETRKEVKKYLRAGLNVADISAQGLNKKWQTWGNNFINENRWIQILVADINQEAILK